MSSDATRSGPSRPRLAADLIAERGFMVVRRGYDQDEVRGFLDQVAAEVRTLHRQLEELADAPAPTVVAPSPAAPAERLPLDEESVVALVGEETANVLRAARTAATEMRRRAEAEAERIIDEARQATGDMRQEAETILAAAQQKAEAAAEVVLRTARAEGDQLLAKARSDAEGVREQAEQDRRLTVDGAQAVREKILGDLSRRRRVATVQIEQLRAGRERLLESYAVVRRTLEEVHEELQRADVEARAAADDAGKRIEAEPDPGLPDNPTSRDAGARAGATPAHSTSGTPQSPSAQPPSAPPPSAPVIADASQPAAPEPAEVLGEAEPLEPAPSPAESTEWVDAGVIIGGDGLEQVRVLRAVSVPAAATQEETGATPEEEAAGPDAEVEVVAAPALQAEPPPPPPPPPPLSPPVAAQPAVPVATTSAPERTPTGRPDDRGVDGMFQRIRAGREASVESARQVLEQDPDPAVKGPRAASVPTRRSRGAGAVWAESPSAVAVADQEVDEQALGKHPGDVEVAEAREHDEGMEPVRSDEDEALLQERDRLVTDIEAGLTKKLKRVLQDEQNELLDRLRGARGTPKAATLLPDEPDHKARLAGAARPLLDQACRAGVSFAGAEGGNDVGSVAVEVADEMVTSLVTPLRRRLTEAIRDNAGDEQSVLVEAIGGVYRECKTQRVEPLVVDGVATAFAKGIFGAVPPGTPLRWVVEDADGPCPDCDDNALAGYLPRGEAFPTGQLHPPAHAGCRCVLTTEGSA